MLAPWHFHGHSGQTQHSTSREPPRTPHLLRRLQFAFSLKELVVCSWCFLSGKVHRKVNLRFGAVKIMTAALGNSRARAPVSEQRSAQTRTSALEKDQCKKKKEKEDLERVNHPQVQNRHRLSRKHHLLVQNRRRLSRAHRRHLLAQVPLPKLVPEMRRRNDTRAFHKKGARFGGRSFAFCAEGAPSSFVRRCR